MTGIFRLLSSLQPGTHRAETVSLGAGILRKISAGGGSAMYVQAYKHARLMEESEWRGEAAARACSPDDPLVSPVFESPQMYRRWTVEHDRLLRTVSDRRRID